MSKILQRKPVKNTKMKKQSTDWAIKNRPLTCQLIMSSKSNVHSK